MKFLCVACDEPMSLVSTAPPDEGSMSVVYACPRCSHRIAMLTNPHETQVVQSLGVRIGPKDDGARTAGEASKCPFSDVVQAMSENASGSQGGMLWTQEALTRLENVPEFVRPMARSGIDDYARRHGYAQVDEDVLDQARDFFGM